MKKAPFTNLTRAAVEKAALPPVRSKPSSPAACSPLDRIARMLREERDLARSQMADELRVQFSHCERISRMTLMEAIAKAEQVESANASGQPRLAGTIKEE